MAVFELDHLHEILQTLRRNRLRTFLTACGIFWGVFMLVVMLGFGRGLEKAVEEDMGFWAINNIGFRADTTSKPYGGRQAGRRVFLTPGGHRRREPGARREGRLGPQPLPRPDGLPRGQDHVLHGHRRLPGDLRDRGQRGDGRPRC